MDLLFCDDTEGGVFLRDFVVLLCCKKLFCDGSQWGCGFVIGISEAVLLRHFIVSLFCVGNLLILVSTMIQVMF